MTFLKTLAAAAAALTLVSVSALAEGIMHGDLMISHTWTRATPPNAKAAGGFVEIMNKGSEADRLIAASADVSAKVEIHEMAVVDDVMKMRELEDGIQIPAGETVTLKPGGLHIMFMGLHEGFKEGTHIPVTLTFEKAGDVAIELDVAKMGSKEMNHDHGHDHGHDHSKHN